jgi:hypothetical protein
MKTLTSVVLACVLVFAIPQTMVGDGGGEDFGQWGACGTVLDNNGNPVADVTITITVGGYAGSGYSDYHIMTTGPAGNFSWSFVSVSYDSFVGMNLTLSDTRYTVVSQPGSLLVNDYGNGQFYDSNALVIKLK